MTSVVINEFELAPAGQDEAGSAAGSAAPAAAETGSASPAGQPKSPVQDAERIIRRHAERMLRLYAH
jgi:hypothetical protein